MKLIKTLLFLLTTLVFGTLQAQDLHWTMFDMSPLTLNPAFTGGFEGTFRVGGIYRSQWNAVSDSEGFETPSFYVDAPILMIGKRSWLGVGGMLYNDTRGTLALERTAFMGSAALHLGLDKKGNSVLSIGLQGGTLMDRVDKEGIIPTDRFDGSLELLPVTSSALYSNINDNGGGSVIDFSAGVKFSSKLGKTSDLTLGLSFAHLFTPQSALVTTSQNNDDVDIPLTTSFHGRFNTALSDKILLTPAFIYQTNSSLNEIALQVLAGYQLNKDITLYLGPAYRMVDNDAVMAIFKVDYKQLRAGIAYDFNVSALSTATNGRGGFEIAASYIARIYKKPTVKPVIFCPRF